MKPVTGSTPSPFVVGIVLALAVMIGPAVIGVLPPALTTNPLVVAVAPVFGSVLLAGVLVWAAFRIGTLHGSPATGGGSD